MTEIDEKLARKAAAGNLNTFETLVSRYQGKIFSFIYRMVNSNEDARDLTQEVFLQVYRSLGHFRGDSSFSNWVYRIASNKCLDFLRRNKKNKTVEFNDNLHQTPQQIIRINSNNPEQVYLNEEKIRRLRRIISGLPDRYRIAIVLFHYENMSYQQISDTLDIPAKTVATRLYRAKLLLKERLGGETDEMQ